MAFLSWVPNAGGDWDVLTNWSIGALPTSDDQVTISTSTIQTITHSVGDDYVGSLAVGNDIFEMAGGTLGVVASAAMATGFTLTGGAMSVGAAMSINSGTTTISGGTLTVGAALKIVGTLSQSGGTISAQTVTVIGKANLLGGAISATTVQASGAVTLANDAFLGATLLKNASTITETGSLTLGDNSGIDATISNQAGATYDLANAVNINSGAATADFVNSGTLATLAGTGASAIDVQATSTGTISIATGSSLTFAGSLTNLSGTISVAAAGALSIGGSVVSLGGTTSLGTGSTLTISGSVTSLGGTTSLATGSTLTLTGSTTTVGGAISGAGTLNFAGGVTTLAAGATIGVGALALDGNGGILALGGNVTESGSFSQANTSTLQLDGHMLTVAGSAQFSGSLGISDSGTLATQGVTGLNGDLAIAGGVAWNNSGTVTDTQSFQIGDTSGTAATLTNAAGGVFNLAVGGISINDGVGSDNFVNAGTLEMTGGTGVSHVYAAITNSGAITATSGTLEIDGALSNSKSVTANAGSINIYGNIINKSTITATNGGTLDIYGAVNNTGYIIAYAGSYIAVNGGGTLGGTIGGAAGSVVLSGTYSVASGATDSVKFATGASFAATGTGAAYLSGAGAIATSGTVAIGNDGGAAVWLENDVIWRNNGTVNDGGNVRFGNGGGDNVTLNNVSGATFNVTAEGTIFQNYGTFATIVNAGLFDKSSGTGVSDIQVAFTNTGTIEAKSGTLEFDGGGTLGGTIGGGAGSVVLTGTYGVAAGQTETVTFGSGVTFSGPAVSSAYLSGAGTIATSGTVAIGNNGGGAMWLENGVTWQNDGTVNDGGNVRFGNGSGDNVTLNNVSGATFNVTAEGTIFQNYGTFATIMNAGLFDKSSGTGVSDIQVAFINTGTIAANSGTLEFDGGGTLGGTIGGGAGSVVLTGTYGVAAGQTETVTFGSGVTFSGPAVSSAYLSGAGTIATSGTVAIGVGGNALILENLVTWQNNGVVSDAGQVDFGDESGDSVTLDNTSGATFDITGAGTIFRPYEGGGVLENAGMFLASPGTGQNADIQVALTNTGTVSANSGTLEFDDGGSNTGLIEAQAKAILTLLGSSIGNAGGTIEAVGANAFVNLSGETINGGFLETSAGGLIEAVTGTTETLNGVGVAAGDVATVAGGGALSVTGTSTLAGTLTLTAGANFTGATVNGSSHLYADGTTTLSGLTIGGTANFTDMGVATESGGNVTVGDATTAAAILSITAKGTYDIADNSGIARGASTSSYISNAGLFEKTGGSGTSAIVPAIANAGTISATSGTLDFQHAITGTGKVETGGGATVEMDSSVAAGQTLLYAAGSTGEFALDDLDIGGSQMFLGTISGFGTGDTLDVGAPFGTGTVPLFAENPGGTGGTLTLTDGSLHAAINFLGSYSTGNFAPTGDGHGGTLLTFQG